MKEIIQYPFLERKEKQTSFLVFAGNCVDKNRNCRWWARYGECRKNPGFMLASCKKSCRQCWRRKKNIHVRDVGNRLRILDRVFFVHGFSKRSMLTWRKILKNHYLKSGPKGCLNKMHNVSVIIDFMNNPTESFNLQKWQVHRVPLR